MRYTCKGCKKVHTNSFMPSTIVTFIPSVYNELTGACIVPERRTQWREVKLCPRCTRAVLGALGVDSTRRR